MLFDLFRFMSKGRFPPPAAQCTLILSMLSRPSPPCVPLCADAFDKHCEELLAICRRTQQAVTGAATSPATSVSALPSSSITARPTVSAPLSIR